MARYGSSSAPVPHDPMSEIVEFHHLGRADVVVVRVGNGLPGGSPGLGRNWAAISAPPKDETKDPVEQADAHKDQYGVGRFFDATTSFGDLLLAPDGKFYRDTPFRPGGAMAEIVNTTLDPVDGLGVRTPSSTEWGERSANYNNQGMYLWWCGMVAQNSLVQSLLVNTRKMTYDFMRRGNKTLPRGSDGYKDIPPESMSVGLFFQTTFPAGTTNMMAEFAAYKFTDPEVSGDFFSIADGSVYANSVRKIARSVVRMSFTEVLVSLNFVYDFKKVITPSINGGSIVELTEEEMGPFENQPGG